MGGCGHKSNIHASTCHTQSNYAIHDGACVYVYGGLGDTQEVLGAFHVALDDVDGILDRDVLEHVLGAVVRDVGWLQAVCGHQDGYMTRFHGFWVCFWLKG